MYIRKKLDNHKTWVPSVNFPTPIGGCKGVKEIDTPIKKRWAAIDLKVQCFLFVSLCENAAWGLYIWLPHHGISFISPFTLSLSVPSETLCVLDKSSHHLHSSETLSLFGWRLEVLCKSSRMQVGLSVSTPTNAFLETVWATVLFYEDICGFNSLKQSIRLLHSITYARLLVTMTCSRKSNMFICIKMIK